MYRASWSASSRTCDIGVPLEHLGVVDPDPAALLGFLRLMEFNTLTRRIAEGLGAEPPAPVETSVGATVPRKGKAAAAPEGAPAVTGAEPQAPRRCTPPLPPRLPFDRSKYETVTTADRLEAWIADARAAGRVAFDTETTRLDPMQAELVGFSLAVAPGKACYVPLGHRRAATELDFGGDVLPAGSAARGARRC